MVSISKHAKEVFYGGTAFVIMLFVVLGYMFPATAEDKQNGETVPFSKGELGKYIDLLAAIFFTATMLVFGLSLYSTFLKMGMNEWNLLAFGIFMMFIYGFAAVSSRIFDYSLFAMIKGIAITIGLLCIAYSAFKIYEPFDEEAAE